MNGITNIEYCLDCYDIQARQYDAIGVPGWNAIDPLNAQYYSISPYAYCGGNPVNFGDYDGREIRVNPCPNGIIENLCYSISSLVGISYNTEFQETVMADIATAKKLDPQISNMIESMEESPMVVSITNSDAYNSYCPQYGGEKLSGYKTMSKQEYVDKYGKK